MTAGFCFGDLKVGLFANISSLNHFMPQAFRNQKRCIAHIYQPNGVREIFFSLMHIVYHKILFTIFKKLLILVISLLTI